MKSTRIFGYFALLYVQVLIGARTASADIILSFEPVRQIGEPTGPAFLLLVADATGDDAFVSFGLDVHYDPLMVEAVEARLDPIAFSGLQLTPDLSQPGVIGLNGFAPFPGDPLSGRVRLALLEFRYLEPGSSLVTASFEGPTQGFGLPFPPGDVVIPEQTASATLIAIPEPGSFSLAMTGILGLLGLGWRRGRKRLVPSGARTDPRGE